jgi:hypothetical protein
MRFSDDKSTVAMTGTSRVVQPLEPHDELATAEKIESTSAAFATSTATIVSRRPKTKRI